MNEAVDSLREALNEKVTDRFSVGDVLKWVAAGRYNYAAIKTSAGWFTTARPGNPFVATQLDYEELVEVLGKPGVSDIQVSTGWDSVL